MHRALYLLILACPTFAQNVTATASVRVDGKVERVRKINGRWWSDENRQMYPPKDKNGWEFWIIDKKSEYRTLNHHRPFQLALAESLHLFMTPDAVSQTLGEPNEVVMHPDGNPGWYHYYAADGTAVEVRFMQNHLLGEAKYARIGGPLGGVMVASVEQDLGGRTIYKVLQEEANKQVAQRAADRAQLHGRQSYARAGATPAPVMNLAPIEAAKPPARRITAEVWKKVTTGMTREEVIAQIGEPLSTVKIAGSDPAVETLQYAFEAEGDAKVRMEEGKVVRVTPAAQ
jgi:hypothetical protein